MPPITPTATGSLLRNSSVKRQEVNPKSNFSQRQQASPEMKLRSVFELLSGNRAAFVSQQSGVSQPLLCIWKRRAIKALAAEFECDPASARELFKEYDSSNKISRHKVAGAPSKSGNAREEIHELRNRLATQEELLSKIHARLAQTR